MRLITVLFIYSIVISVSLIVINVVFGWKKGIRRSAICLGNNIISALIAFGISKLFTRAFLHGLTASTLKKLQGLFTEQNGVEVLTANETEIIVQTVAYFFFPFIFFIVVYGILNLVLHIPVNHIYKTGFKEKDDADGSRPHKIAAAGIRFLSGAITMILLLSPVASVSVRYSGKSINSYSYSENYGKAVDKLAYNPIIFISRNIGGKQFYDGLTTFRYDGHKYSAAREFSDITRLCFSVIDMMDKDVDDYNDRADNAKNSFHSSDILPPFVAKTGQMAATYWESGEDFWGVSPKIESDYSRIVYVNALKIFKRWTSEDVEEDFDTLVDFVELLQDYDLLEDNSTAHLFEVFSDSDFLNRLVEVLFYNENMRELIPVVFEQAMLLTAKKIGSFAQAEFERIKSEGLTLPQLIDEAEILAGAIGELVGIERSAGTLDIRKLDASQQKKVKNVFDELSQSQILGGTADKLSKFATNIMATN